MGLLWNTTELYTKDRDSYLLPEHDVSTRRVGFPTWSWSSIKGPVLSCQDSEVIYNIYQRFAMEVPNNQVLPWPMAHFLIKRRGADRYMDLCHAQTLYEPTGPKNINVDRLIVEGDIVKARLIKPFMSSSVEFFRCCDSKGTPIPSFSSDTKAETNFIETSLAALDLPSLYLESHTFTELYRPRKPTFFDTINRAFSRHNDFENELIGWTISSELDDALVLVDWEADAPEGETRWVLMLLKWLDEDTAERVGILGKYQQTFPTKCIDKMPRRRKRFLLI